MSTEPRGWQAEADRLANESLERGDPTGWFEELYAAGESGEVEMAWDREDPHPLLAEWTARKGLEGAGRRAVVIGAGLGADAQHVVALGFDVSAFDLSPTAVRTARHGRATRTRRLTTTSPTSSTFRRTGTARSTSSSRSSLSRQSLETFAIGWSVR